MAIAQVIANGFCTSSQATETFSAAKPESGFGDFGSVPTLQPAVVVPPSDYELRVNSAFERQWARYRKTLVRSQSEQIDRFSFYAALFGAETGKASTPLAMDFMTVPLMVGSLGSFRQPIVSLYSAQITPPPPKPAFAGSESVVIRGPDPNAKPEDKSAAKEPEKPKPEAVKAEPPKADAAPATASSVSSQRVEAQPSFLERTWLVWLAGGGAIIMIAVVMKRGRKNLKMRYAQQ